MSILADLNHSSSVLAQKYKLVFLGDQSVGKTSIINRFIFDSFDGKDHPTVGIDFIAKTLYFDDKAIKLQLWDTAGQERFRALIPSYIRDCTAAIICYDVTSKSSFTSINKWVEDARNERGNDVIIMIVGNKTDLEDKREVTKEEGEALAKELETLFIETSAKGGTNITNLFHNVAALLPGVDSVKLTLTEQQMNATDQNGKENGNNNTVILNKDQIAEEDVKKKKAGCGC